MEWECFPDMKNKGDWRVEAIDFEDEGALYVTIFSGPDARGRAREYAAIKAAQEALRGISQPTRTKQANAVLDALRQGGVTHFDMPATPHRVWQAIRAANAKAD